jgi:hypothetical protein
MEEVTYPSQLGWRYSDLGVEGQEATFSAFNLGHIGLYSDNCKEW